MIAITSQTIVKNDENWIWFALKSVQDQVAKMLVLDDNSTDATRAIIETITTPKLSLETKVLTTPQEHTEVRNQMLARTTTDWFLLLDGDEVWNNQTLYDLLIFLEKQPKNIYGVVMRTRNCVGDVFHYASESAGHYHLMGRTGHLTIRAYRKLPGFHWTGTYPLEAYVDAAGQPIHGQSDHLAFFDGFYWHMTHLVRSAAKETVKGHRRVRLETGIKIAGNAQLPEVFFIPRPAMVSDPLGRRGIGYELASHLVAPLKTLKRGLVHD